MPNLIEQQDLLKGLPDARLAMLLQNPIGDIPPFLVAAEAQRRQAIRQQFAGPDSKESVVDSLTKQMTGAQENIQGQTSPTPPVPATPQMQGVAALQQQQMQQAAQQGMAGGGAVQRYKDRGLVIPTVESLSDTYYTDPLSIPDVSEGDTSIIENAIPDLGLPPLFPHYKTPEEVASESVNPYKQAYEKGYRGIGVMPGAKTAAQADEQSRLKKQYEQYAASRKTEPEPYVDEDRKRLEELFAAQEPSGWDNAQKWFAMSQQFLDPSKTTMESIASAGSAFADASAAQEQARRQLELEKKKALMDYDINKKATATQNTIESLKYQAEQAMEDAKIADREASDAAKELSDYQKMAAENPLIKLESDPTYQALAEKAKAARQNASDSRAISQYYRNQYGKLMGTYGQPMAWRDGKLVPIGG